MYNEDLKRKDAVIASLKKAIIEMNDRAKKEIRRELIANILSTANNLTEEQRKKTVDILVRSGLPIDFIKEQYQPTILNSSNNPPKHNFYL